MKLYLPLAIYQWLQKLGVITQQGNINGKNVEICFDYQLYFENGFSIGNILRQINKYYQLGLKNLGKIRQIATIKSHENWYIIWYALRKLGIDTFYDSPDITIIPVILGQLYNKFYETEDSIHKPHQHRKKLTIYTFNPYKYLYYAESAVELILLALCQSFKLSAEIAISLLADRHQLFNRLIVQGTTQSRFYQIHNFVRLLHDEKESLQTMAKKYQSMGYIIELLRAGFVSSNLYIVKYVMTLIKSLQCRYEMSEHISVIHRSMKRHCEIGPMLCEFMQWTLHYYLVTHLKYSFQTYFQDKSDFLLAAYDMVRHMNYSIYKKYFIESNVHQDWLTIVEYALDPDDHTNNSKLFMRGISLLTELALLQDDNSNRKLSQLLYKHLNAKNISDNTMCHSLHCCQCTIKLLIHHAYRQRKEARKYYQLLCDVLSMLPHNHDTYQFILNNMKLLFNRFVTMPQYPLLSALYKREVLNYPSDYSILYTLLGHSSLKLYNRYVIGRLSVLSFMESLGQHDFRNLTIKSLSPYTKYLHSHATSYLSCLFEHLKTLIMIPVNKTNRTQIKKSPEKTAKSKKSTRIFYTQSYSNELVNYNKKTVTIKLIIDILRLLDRYTLKDVKKIATGIKEELHKQKLPLTLIEICLTKIKYFIDMNRLEFREEEDKEESEDKKAYRYNTIVADSPSRLYTPIRRSEEKHKITPVSHERLKYKLKEEKYGINEFKFRDHTPKNQLKFKENATKDEIKLKDHTTKNIHIKDVLYESVIIQKDAYIYVSPLLPYSEEPPTLQPALLVYPDLVEYHYITYLQYLSEKHQKLFGSLFQSYIRLGHDVFTKQNHLDKLLLPSSLHILLQYTGKISKSPQLHFYHWLTYIAYKAYETNAELSEAQKLSRLLDHIKLQFKSRGYSTLLFEDPDEVYYKQSEQVRKLTEDAKRGDQLPDGFVSHIVRVQNYDHTVSHKFKLQQKYVISYQILSELLNQILNVPLVEPVLVLYNKLSVRPQVAMQVHQISPKKYSPYRRPIKRKMEYSSVSKMANSSVDIDRQRLQKIAERRKVIEYSKQQISSYHVSTYKAENFAQTTYPNVEPTVDQS